MKEYAAFEEKVKRTILIDSLSPAATEAVVRASLDQFGNVIQVKFIPNYLEPKTVGLSALVELENADQAKTIISEISSSSFMICGMPRPVRARAAEVEMFDDRPIKPGRKIVCRWLDSSDPDFEVTEKIKHLVSKHAEEAKFCLKVNFLYSFQRRTLSLSHFYSSIVLKIYVHSHLSSLENQELI